MIQYLLYLAFVLVVAFGFWLSTEIELRHKRKNNPRNNYKNRK